MREHGNAHRKEAKWVPVLVARDRSYSEAEFVLGRFTLDKVERCLMPRLGADIVLCTDGHLASEALSAKYHLAHEVLNASAGQRVKAPACHIQG